MQMKRKQLITIEWRVAESDREWAQLCQPPAPAVKRQRGRLRRLGAALLLMVSLSGAGGWWYATQAEFKQIQAEVTAAVQQEGSVTATTWSAIDPTRPLEPEQAEVAALVAPTVRVLARQGDQVIVMVVPPPVAHAPTYRQTQFYRRTGAGWQQTAPDATMWGPPQELETASFRWRYRQNDAQVIAAVAPN